jgi:2-oxoglutarate dehydrogenase E2 component (dihydrolipoamide succinyltransferase)
MPQLGETVAEGTVTRWLVQVGGEVRANEPLFEVSTDKVDTEVASPADGVLASVVVAEDETVPVGTVLATVETGDGAGPDVPDSDRTEYGAEDAVPVAPAAGRSGPAAGVPDSDRTEYASGDPTPVVPAGAGHGRPRHRASPRARRLARERGLDLAGVGASGASGRVTARDVLNAAPPGAPPASAPVTAPPGAPAPAPAAAPTPAAAARGERVEKLSRRRRLIAERMTRSLHETAQLTTVVEVDLTRVVRAREAVKEEFRRRHGAPLTVLAFVAEAAVRALGQHPVVNARLDLDAGSVTYPAGVGLGIAVDTEQGLIVPVVRDAEDLSVGGLARRIAAVAARSRDGSIGADELSGGTFTITNTGSRGALFDTPILNPPESAILGLGAAVRRPVVLTGPDGEDRIAVRSMAYLALSYDHRLVDGADAARFLGSVKDRLEQLDAARADSVL